MQTHGRSFLLMKVPARFRLKTGRERLPRRCEAAGIFKALVHVRADAEISASRMSLPRLAPKAAAQTGLAVATNAAEGLPWLPMSGRAYMSSPHGATWRSGYATVCKTVYTSSILVVASTPYQALRPVFGRVALSTIGHRNPAETMPPVVRHGRQYQHPARDLIEILSGPPSVPGRPRWHEHALWSAKAEESGGTSRRTLIL